MTGIVEGKIALVTGGGGGIGRAAALAFARKGARVAVADFAAAAARDTVAQINAAGGQAITLTGDVTRAEDVRAMVQDTLSAYGRRDAIIAQIPFRRMGEPGEIAEMVVWLCSERASYVSGASYNVDGGWMAV